MTLFIRRTHWVVFSLLLVAETLAMVVMARRSLGGSNIAWLYLGFVAVPRNFHGMFIAFAMVTSLCFVNAIIIVTLLDVIRSAQR